MKVKSINFWMNKNSRETFPDGNSKMQEEIKSNENRNYVVKPL